jgi:hypothetical protein
MTSVVSSASASNTSLFSPGSNWLADTMTAIKNQSSSGGMLGALQNSGDGSISSFLSASSSIANSFALISQSSVTDSSSFYAQIASQNIQNQQEQKLQQAMADLQRTQQMVQPSNVLDPVIYFSNGSTLDTNSNILTLSDGRQIDAITGTKIVDSAYIIQMANGSYLDTQNNILTMADGTQIDTVTGLTI